MAREKPISTMVVGLGRIGWRYHIKAAAENPHFQVTAAVDNLPERRREAETAYRCATFATIDKALKAGLAELAVICTPSIYHCGHTVKALEAGCHVFLEKPAAMNLREFDRMTAAAKKARKVFTINQSLRAMKPVRFVRETIDSGILGKVFWIRISGLQFFRRNDWQTLRKFGGGLIYNGGSHAVDTGLCLLDSTVHDVWGDVKRTVSAGDADDCDKIVIRGASGRIIEIDQSYGCALPQPSWLVCGTTGSMQIDGEEARLKYFDPAKAPRMKVITTAPAGRKYGNDDKLPWREKTVPVEPAIPFPDFYDALYRSIRRGAKPLVTPESVREAVRVLDEVRRKSLWK